MLYAFAVLRPLCSAGRRAALLEESAVAHQRRDRTLWFWLPHGPVRGAGGGADVFDASIREESRRWAPWRRCDHLRRLDAASRARHPPRGHRDGSGGIRQSVVTITRCCKPRRTRAETTWSRWRAPLRRCHELGLRRQLRRTPRFFRLRRVPSGRPHLFVLQVRKRDAAEQICRPGRAFGDAPNVALNFAQTLHHATRGCAPRRRRILTNVHHVPSHGWPKRKRCNALV
mmetsp:Transcript_23837/g.60213  ORF Transcript_23837/g.60213 Transcript_23837/m.60213 type:complete len:229 (+) Transcript_23837:35-721(+)